MDNTRSKICKCGNNIVERIYETKSGVKKYTPKYCSRKCAYSLRVRPSGLDYKVVNQNKGWFKKGFEPWSKNNKDLMPTPWNKGVKGYIGANKTSFKKGQMTGENNVNWKGGITPINMQIRQSSEYKDWRTEVFKRDNYTCQDCGSRGVTLHADHIKPFAYFPELRLVIDNGRTLCVGCHRNTNTYGIKAKKQYERKQTN